MSPRKKGLGRGLDALLSASEVVQDGHSSAVRGDELRKIALTDIQPGRHQPRRSMDEQAIEDMARSLRRSGLVQPILLRPLAQRDGEGAAQYEIVAGERRWRAAQKAGMTEIASIVRELSDESTAIAALVENIQREDLNPLDEAQALDGLGNKLKLTHQQIADATGKSRAAVTNSIRLLSLCKPVQTMLADGDLSMGHARALLALPAAEQAQLARMVVARQLSVRQTEALMRGNKKPDRPPPEQDPDTRRLQTQLAERIGARTAIVAGKSGSGKLVIHYKSLEQLDGILARIR